MKKLLHPLGAIVLVASCYLSAYGQKTEKGPWKKIQESSIPVSGTRYIKPTKYLTFRLDVEAMRQRLDEAKRITDPAYVPVYIELPKADGSAAVYKVYENTTMSEGLAAQFPEIRAFDGIPVDGSGEMVKLDLTPQGFHAMILYPDKPSEYIDPYSFGGGDITHYIVYSKADFVSDKVFQCHFESVPTEVSELNGPVVKSFGSCQKRTYRLALAATGEYTTFQGGTVALAQAAQVTTMNRVNGVYMRDMAITMTIIANNNLLIYTNANTDPYTNGDPGSMITENQTNVTSVIGSANYDIGHVFGTNSGGLAGLGVVCTSSQKARGVTGSAAPVGDAFDIDYVAHEMGHEFSGNHTFRGSTGSCGGGNANNATAMEPGSGSTIMAYAGICAPQDVQSNSDDHFHGISLQEIGTFITGAGHTCPVVTSIASQSAPVISATNGNVTIPINTPFALTATATDADGDVLTYCWEQMNNDNSTQPPVATNTGGPNFRSFSPTTNPTRYFPKIATQLAGGPYTWEVLPSVSRTMSFRVVVRDNEVNGGCNDHEDVTVTTTSSAGPFLVNYPSASGITWPGNSTQTVTWSVANTNVAPVSCSNVDVMISTDGGATFSVIANDVTNDGSQDVTVPNVSTTNAIIMVICANGTFFDISNNVFAITAATNDYTVSIVNNAISACQGTDGTFSIQVGQIGGYSDPVTLSATGLPGTLSASFSPNPVTPGNTSTLTISGTSGTTPGAYPFNVQGSSTSGTHTSSATMSVSTSASVVSTLQTPVDADPSVSLPASLTWSNANAGMLFDVEIATDAAFTNIVETATGLSAATYAPANLVAATTYYWRVNSYNSCSNAGNSSVFSFTTAACGTFASTNVPVAISASGTPTVTSTLNITAEGTINDLNVTNLAGTHTYVSDLSFTLTSPSGTTVTLFNGLCGSDDNFDIVMDDEGAAASSIPCPFTDGNAYQSQDALSAFDGETMTGTWTLTVSDAYNEDGGALESWSLQICFTPVADTCSEPGLPTLAGTTTICPGESTSLSVSAGALNDATDWHWYSGSCGGTAVGTGTSVTVSTTGTYYVRGEGGCVVAGSCQTITVTQNNVNVNTTLIGGVIASSQNGATYQWIDCNNGNAAIAGATSQSYTPSVNGSYAVEVTYNGCTETSSCVNYNQVGLSEFYNASVQLFPNPTTGLFTVSFGKSTPVEFLTVTDVTGRLIRAEQAFTADKLDIDLSAESKGVYFLNVQIAGRLQTLKISRY